jgi:ligand-binding sensor domain-containing protein
MLISIASIAQYPGIHKIRVNIPSVDPIFTISVQDKDGYLWLGSDKGLFRFDGLNFKQFFPRDDSADFQVSALFEDQDRSLWIGCKNGMIYRILNGEMSRFNPEEGTSAKAISDIVVDNDRTLWWSTTGEGIYCSVNGRVYNFNKDDGLKDDYVYDLEYDSNGLVWAGSDGGLVSCSFKDGRKSVHLLEASISLPDIIVTVVKKDDAGNLWLGFHDGGAGYLLADRSGFIKPQNGDAWVFGPVKDIAVEGNSAWIGTTSGELVEIDLSVESGQVKNLLPEGQIPGKIHDLLSDREGNIWVLSVTGLYRTSGNRLRFINTVEQNPLENIHAIKADEVIPQKIWYSDDHGLFSLDISKRMIKKYLGNFSAPDLKITCLFQDNFGYIWAGTFNYGVFRLRPGDGSWTRITEKQGLVNDNVLAISRHDDTLWMATLGGASEIVLQGDALDNSYKIRSFDYKSGLVNNFIYSVYEDKVDQIWLATDGDGIDVKTKKGWITFNDKDGLTDDVIYSITGDKYGNIWIASASKGIYKFNDNKFLHFGIDEGLSSLEISGITSIADEVIIVNENGLDILHIPTGKIAHYGDEAGLNGILPDLNVISQDRNGNVWLGTGKGIIRYRPGRDSLSYGPKTVLKEMSIYLEPLPMESEMALRYTENHVSFQYSGLWYSSPEKVLYQVMLEGYDLGWKDTYDRHATYSSLSPGDYTFRVRSSLDKSFVNASETSFSFRIKQAFFLRDWFIIMLIIVFAVLIYLLISIRENNLRKKEEEKKEKIEFEFQVLKNQVNPHFLFNSFSTLMSLIEDHPEQALQYTEKLSDFFRTILQFKDQQVISLDDELSLIDSYFFLLKKRYGDNLHLDIDLDKTLGKTFIPPMTLQIVIENAVKHNVISKGKPLFIRIYNDEGRIFVENNLQPKLTAEVSTGIGLENIRKRYRLITDEEPVFENTHQIYKVKLPIIT